MARREGRGPARHCEVTPHHLFLTEDAIGDEYNTFLKVNPPLRTAEDAAALIEGVKDGTVDAIVTDHAPHSDFEKDREFELAPFGMIGLETSLSARHHEPRCAGRHQLGARRRAHEREPARHPARRARVALEPGLCGRPHGHRPGGRLDGGRRPTSLSKAANSGFIGAELTGRATDVYVGRLRHHGERRRRRIALRPLRRRKGLDERPAPGFPVRAIFVAREMAGKV